MNHTSKFISDERSLTGDAFKTLNVLLMVCGAMLGFGSLEAYPATLIAISLILLVFAHLFLFLRSRFEIDCMRYEEAFNRAPKNHPANRLTDWYNNSSGVAGIMTAVLSLAAVATLCIGMIDQFVTTAIFPRVNESIVVTSLILSLPALLMVWGWLFIRLNKTLSDFVI